MDEKTYTEAEAHRHFAVELNSEVWRLFEKADRSPAEDELMIHTAHSCTTFRALAEIYADKAPQLTGGGSE